jgi:hypothetical protein
MKAKLKMKKIWETFLFSKLYFWIGGFIAFLWVISRSGMNPKRLTYPCQQAAFPLASTWLIAVAAFFSGTFLLKYFTRLTIAASLIVGMGWALLSFIKAPDAVTATSAKVWEVSNPVSEIFVLDNMPPTSGSVTAGNATVPNANLVDRAIDSLVMIMDAKGLYLLKTGVRPTGLIGSDETVIIKGNFQWDGRLSTNTDRIKGLINHILNHPDGFTGEILVCDNAQNSGRPWTNCNNSDDETQTITDVTNTFKAKGYPVDLVKWDLIMNSTVAEYSAGNTTSGFTYDATTKVSYPKFQTPKGTYVSLKYGIWNGSSYDRSKLCVINIPVCKAHGYSGATLAIKNWVGAMSLTDKVGRYGSEDNMHLEYFLKSWALPARVIAEATPDLNIIDATWTAPTDNHTAGQSYVNTNTIMASTDPVAISWYAAKHILTPVAASKTYTNPDRVYSSTPGLYDCPYTYAFKNWANYLITTKQMNFTRDSTKISVYGRNVLLATKKLIKDEESIKVFPNPCSNKLTVNCTHKSFIAMHYKIYNSLGKFIYEKRFDGMQIDIDIQTWKSGVYIVQLWEDKKILGTQRFIKQ